MFDLKGYELVRNFFDPKEILNESNKVINAAQKKNGNLLKYITIFTLKIL